MSAICGLISWGKVSEPLPQLAKMLQALAHHGMDGTGRWYQEDVALGHQTLHVTKESRLEQEPLHDAPASLAITADVRLDNRADLCQQLQIPHRERTEWSDSLLILAAYQKWGEAFPKYLLGDFAVALWDGQRRKLLCCRDHLGMRPLFYYYREGQFAFASEVKGILPILPSIHLNQRKIALLAYRAVMKQETESTFFADVLGIPAATLLIVNEQGIHQQCYWEPNLNARLDVLRDEEVLEGAQELVFDAVRTRLRSVFPVTSLLSGGLDSSAIVSVAASYLAEQGQRLTTLSSVLPASDVTVADLSDERKHIDEFRTWPNIDLHYVTAPDQGPLDNIEQLIWQYECPIPITTHYLYSAFIKATRNTGARVILDGVGGELGLTFHGAGGYTELLFRNQWSTLWRELTLRSRHNGSSAWQVFRSHVLTPLLPDWVELGLRARLYGQPQRSHVLQQTFLTQQLGKDHGKLEKEQQTRMRERLFHRDNQYAAICRARKPARVAGFIGYEQVQMRYPLQDKRLLEFCLAAPLHLKIRDGYNRYLVRGSLDKILPPKIQWRTTKKPFSPDFHLRYNAQRMQMVRFFDEIRSNDPVREIVDVETLKQLASFDLTNGRHRASANFAATHLVPHGIYLITFLRQFGVFQR